MDKGFSTSLARKEAGVLGHWIRQQREGRSWSRRELSRRMGYQNLDKGCSRIADWESARDIPRGDRAEVLCKALGVESQALQDLLKGFRDSAGRMNQALEDERLRQRKVAWAELRLLKDHHVRLLEHADEILMEPALAGIRIGAASVHLAYVGGSTLTLGDLLLGWREGGLVIEEESGPLYLLRIAGSPLSGRGSVLGFKGGEEDFQGRRPPSIARRGVPVLRAVKQASRCASGLSLAQLLSDLGVQVPDLVIWDECERELWRYGHRDRVLVGQNGELQLPLVFEHSARTSEARWSPCWEQGKGPLTIGQISPFRGGTWRGDDLAIHDSRGRVWTAPPGCLNGPNRSQRYRLSCISPPALLKWLVGNLEE